MPAPVGDLPTALVAVWVALLGAVLGSFLNVVIARVPPGESIVRPGSRCPRCRAAIAWYDNVPVVSWLVLRGRCRACGAPIPVRYPAVELLGAVFALAAWWRHGLTAHAAAELVLADLLLALAFIDLDTWLLPHALTWPLIAAGLGAALLGVGPAPSPSSAASGAGAGFAAFALVAWAGEKVFRREALGFGDVWLLAGIGAWLGAGALLPVVMFAAVQGSIVGIALLALGRGEPGPPPSPHTEAPLAAPSPADASPPPASPAAPIPGPPPADAAAPAATGPAPAAAEAGAGAAPGDLGDQDWVPPRNAVPFGPFLAAAALEWLWLGDALARAVPAFRIFR